MDRLHPVDWISIVLALIIVAGTLAAPYAEAAGLLPEESICLSVRIAGTECPGCGMTRSVVALGRGDLTESLRINWIAPTMLLIALAHLVARASRIFGFNGSLRPLDLSTIMIIIVILIVRSLQIWA